MTQFTIYTEDKNYEQIRDCVSKEFNGATFQRSDGLYKTELEESLVITIIGRESNRGAVHSVAHAIKALNEQESVLVTQVRLDSAISL